MASLCVGKGVADLSSPARFNQSRRVISCREAHAHMQRTMAAISENRLRERVIANFAIWKGTGNNSVIKWKMLDRCHRFVHTCL